MVNPDVTGSVTYFDSCEFIIEEIGQNVVIGHFILNKKNNPSYSLPSLRLEKGQAAILNGVKIRTTFKIKYSAVITTFQNIENK